MPEHYPRHVQAIKKFCNKCGRLTMHAVTGKTVGHCTEHGPTGMTKAQEKARELAEQRRVQPELF